jgi:ribosomal protein L24
LPTGTDWSELRPGDKVSIVRGNRVTASGIVDAMTEDASTVWVLFEGVAPRRMFHRGDPDELRPVR